MYLITSTRCGISAKQLERELGVTYKTAWRMFNLIRKELMTQDDDKLGGNVEADETYVGGSPRLKDVPRKADGSIKKGRSTKPKVTVFGAVERGGRVRCEVVPRGDSGGIPRRVHEFILPEAVLFTDEYVGYDKPGKGFAAHHRIRHQAKIYVAGDVHTQTIEGFWSLVKRGLSGTHHSVSAKHLQGYLNEYVWRYNHRDDDSAQFLSLILRAATVEV
jgi:transposase-like protein